MGLVVSWRLSAVETIAMFKTPASKFAARMRRLMPGRIARRFLRRQDGVAAVEFALIATPFLALTFAIIETAFVFFASQTLEATTADSARLIMTGQAQLANWSQTDFKTAVCARIYGMFDCDKIYVDVKSYTTFASIDNSSPIVNKTFDTTKMTYAAGVPGDIVVVKLYYEWPLYVSMLGNDLSNLNGGNRLLVATAVFRNEPYK
jgi:Flp pilus assembly protein TadG